jgi:hypothetical protein
MKTSTFAISALSLGSLVTAAPLKAKRDDVVWVTDVHVVTTYLELTTTVWVDQLPARTSAAGAFFENPKPANPTPAAATTSTPATSSTPAAVAPETPVVQPTQPAQVQSPVETPSPAAQTSSPAAGSGSSSPPASGQVYTGDITFYDPDGNYGSCGDKIQNSEDAVALPLSMMKAVSSKSNGHPWCGKKIAIQFNGQTFTATVKDSCPGCNDGDVDMTSGLFKKVTGGTVDGRGKGLAKWSFVE